MVMLNFILLLCLGIFSGVISQDAITQDSSSTSIATYTATGSTILRNSTGKFMTTTAADLFSDTDSPSATNMLIDDAVSMLVCVRDFSEQKFFLKSPGYPGKYENHVVCRYYIQQASDDVCSLRVTFIHFDLESSENCTKDYLDISSGERLCGSIKAGTKREYPFDYPEIVVTFITDGQERKSGFHIHFEQLKECHDLTAISAVHACNVLITDIAGEVVSRREYEVPPLCRYTIGRYSASYCYVELDFVNFNVDFSPDCTNNFLELEGKRYCGASLHKQRKTIPYDSRGNVYITYQSGSRYQDKGFRLLFRQLPCSSLTRPVGSSGQSSGSSGDMCNRIFYEQEFYLESPNFPANYDNRLECRFIIRRLRETVCRLELTFLDFDVEASSGCRFDYLQVDRDRLCGKIPDDFVRMVEFTTYEKILHFHTDDINPRPGFFLFVRQIDCAEPSPASGGAAPGPDSSPSTGGPQTGRPQVGSPQTGGSQTGGSPTGGSPSGGSPTGGSQNAGPQGGSQSGGSQGAGPQGGGPTGGSPSGASPTRPVSGCDREIWDRETLVTSPGYPLGYPGNSHCRYIVRRLHSNICHLQFSFIDFQLQGGSGCLWDYLVVDGKKICGNVSSGTIRTFNFNSPQKVFVFHTDTFISKPGFVVQVRQIECGSRLPASGMPESCNREIEVVDFDLVSVNHPDNYDNGLRCQYVIKKSSDTVCQLELSFRSFDLERSRGCTKDYLLVDGEPLCDPMVANSTRILDFTTREKVFVFNSDRDITASGFFIRGRQMECIPAGANCDRVFDSIEGTFSSPGYPSPYPNRMDCRFTFRLQPGYCRMEYTFTVFQLQPPEVVCYKDFLELGGRRYCSRQLEGQTRTEPPFGSAAVVTLRFAADERISEKGFFASYRQLPCGSPETSVSTGTGGTPITGGTPAGGGAGGGVVTTGGGIVTTGGGTPGAPDATRTSVCISEYSTPDFDIRSPDLSTYVYGQTVECTYMIRKMHGAIGRIRVTFLNFDLGASQDCHIQYLQIGPYTVCGRLPAYTIREYTFPDPLMQMRFHAILSAIKPYFYLRVQQTLYDGPDGPMLPPVSPGSPRSPPIGGCDQTLEYTTFEIRSPLYPINYPPNSDCRYIIRSVSPLICSLELTFERFDVTRSQNCYTDYVRVDNDRLCGVLAPYLVRTYDFRTAEKIIYFRSGFMTAGTGFVIRGRQVPCGGESPPAAYPPPQDGNRDHQGLGPSKCDQSYGLDSFTIYSPNYPQYYPNSAFCRYVVLKSSDLVCGLEITFISFDVEEYYQCLHDYLEIDGWKLCGYLPSNTIRFYRFDPADRIKTLVFRSDYSNNRPGFALRVQQTSNCHSVWTPGQTIQGGSRGGGGPDGTAIAGPFPNVHTTTCTTYLAHVRGYITSPNFPRNYDPNSHCLYRIEQVYGYCSVQLFFYEFDIEYAPGCQWDYLDVEGTRHCGTELAGRSRDIPFSWQHPSAVVLVFHADGRATGRGFHIDYRQIPCRQARWSRHEPMEEAFSENNGTVSLMETILESSDDPLLES